MTTNLKNKKKKQKDVSKKYIYTKPQLGSVSLFADQVLGVCFDPLPSSCATPDPTFGS